MTGLLMKYFVLSPTKEGPYGRASRVALRAYAKAIREENQQLSDDLRKWADECQYATIDNVEEQ